MISEKNEIEHLILPKRGKPISDLRKENFISDSLKILLKLDVCLSVKMLAQN